MPFSIQMLPGKNSSYFNSSAPKMHFLTYLVRAKIPPWRYDQWNVRFGLSGGHRKRQIIIGAKTWTSRFWQPNLGHIQNSSPDSPINVFCGLLYILADFCDSFGCCLRYDDAFDSDHAVFQRHHELVAKTTSCQIYDQKANLAKSLFKTLKTEFSYWDFSVVLGGTIKSRQILFGTAESQAINYSSIQFFLSCCDFFIYQ